MSRAIVLLGIGLSLALSGAASAKDYEIKLHRPVAVGMRYQIGLTLTRQDTSLAKVDGESQKPEEFTSVVQLSGTVEVLAVNEKGFATAEEYSVSSCTQTINGKVAELIRPGSPLVVQLTSNGVSIDLDGEPLPPEIRVVVADLFDMSAGVVVDDEVFGSAKRRNVGDAWAPIPEGVAKFAKAAGFPNEGLTGKTVLVSVKKVGGAECLELSSVFNAAEVKPPEGSVPPKFTVQKASMKSVNWGLYPADNRSLPVHEKTTTDNELTVTGARGSAKVVATTLSKQIRETKRGPLPKAVP